MAAAAFSAITTPQFVRVPIPSRTISFRFSTPILNRRFSPKPLSIRSLSVSASGKPLFYFLINQHQNYYLRTVF